MTRAEGAVMDMEYFTASEDSQPITADGSPAPTTQPPCALAWASPTGPDMAIYSQTSSKPAYVLSRGLRVHNPLYR